MKIFKLIMFRFFVLAFCLMTGISAYADGTININTGTGTGTGFTFTYGAITIITNGTYRIVGDGTQTENRIVVNNGVTATIILDNVNISCAYQSGKSAFYMQGATVKLLLAHVNTLQSGEHMAGILASTESSILTIDSETNPGYFAGTLTVSGGSEGAGIGGGDISSNDYDGGIITINGGTVTANGGNNGAGIGGCFGTGGTITINGGIVTANAGSGAAGIGGGLSGNNGGTITINGGIVTATNHAGYYYSAAIGGGAFGDSGNIHITGGAVVAKGGSGVSIGCASNYTGSSSGSISITGGTVYGVGYGVGMGGPGGNTTTATSIGQNAIVFANTINPNATIAPLAITKTTLPHTINNNGNVTIQLGIGATAIYSIHKLIIPHGITITLNTSYNLYFENYGVIRNFGAIQSNTQIINHDTIINNGVINGNIGMNSVKTGILGEWIQDIPEQFYTGGAITPDVTIIKPGTGALRKNQDYIIKLFK